jgi:formylglycine-generating enzyme required for sulfatase activity
MREPSALSLPRVSLALTASSIGILLLSQVAEGQAPAPCRRATAFAAGELLDALANGAAPTAVARLTVSCGTSFALTAELEQRFRTAGADDGLLAAMRKMSPPLGAAAGTRWLSPVDSSEMIAVGSGAFQMGSPLTEPGRDADELQHYQQVFDAMWVDTTEVTYAAFRRFVISVPYWQKGRPSSELVDSNYLMDWNGTEFPMDRGNEPVTWVSWHAAKAYAIWAGKRLPTEAEWEFVARSGTTTRYWWGDTFEPRRVRGGNSDVRTRRTPWGLQDMLGSLWEWVSTVYAEYPYDSSKTEVAGGGRRVVRGGAMNSGEQFVRAANRSAELPALTSDLIGFRCVR